MFQEKSDNSYTAPVKKQQKSQKEKTLATAHKNNQGQFDLTKELSNQEIALITQNNHSDLTSTGVYTDSIADYYPGKYQKHSIVSEPLKKEEEKKVGYISSYVGNYESNSKKSIVANLAKDVIFVQEHLKRLNILSEKDFTSEKPTANGEITKSKILKTIEAIHWFQEKVLHYKTKYGYVIPGKGSITSLVNISVKQKEDKYKLFLAKEKAEKDRLAKEKAKVEKEAEINRIKNEPATKENLNNYYKQLGSIEAFGKFLKDYVLLNPNFVLMAYELMDMGEPDNLTRAIMYNLKDSEIERLSESLNTKFYEALDAGWTVEEEYSLMAKLKAGRKPVGEKEEGGKKEKTKKDNLKLAEKGKELLKNKYYHKHYAYLPFTGPKSGKKYEKGDFIVEEDRIATYGSENKPTWCNMFARDLIKEVKGFDPFDGDKSAEDILKYMSANRDVFVSIEAGFEDAWINVINKNEIVFLSDDGHVAVGVPTELRKEHLRTYTNAKGKEVTEKIGYVIQAGKSHGHMILSKAWSKKRFKNIKMFKYVPKE